MRSARITTCGESPLQTYQVSVFFRGFAGVFSEGFGEVTLGGEAEVIRNQRERFVAVRGCLKCEKSI